MKLPSRIVDISVALDNDTVLDPPFMRPKIDYQTPKQNGPLLASLFPGLTVEQLPDGEGWAFELVNLATHNGKSYSFEAVRYQGTPPMITGVHTTGNPTGFLRTDRPYENFILELEWRHMRKDGNAGLFIWSDAVTSPGVPFTRSIEVQILDDSTDETTWLVAQKAEELRKALG